MTEVYLLKWQTNEIKTFNLEGDRYEFNGEKIGKKWRPMQMVPIRDRPARPATDMAGVFGSEIAVFSERACDALRDLLEANGELLPLKSTKSLGDYFVFNATTVQDAFDAANSEIEHYEKGSLAGLIKRIHAYAFREDAFNDTGIFKLLVPGKKGLFIEPQIFVTQQFVDRVNEHELTGFAMRPATARRRRVKRKVAKHK